MTAPDALAEPCPTRYLRRAGLLSLLLPALVLASCSQGPSVTPDVDAMVRAAVEATATAEWAAEATVSAALAATATAEAAAQAAIDASVAATGGPLFTLEGEVAGINTSVIRETRSGRPVEGFGFAVSASTVEVSIPAMKAGSRLGGPTPTPTVSRGFGPVDGSLDHDDDGRIEMFFSDVRARDLVVTAVFTNPHRWAWDYGFTFRNTGINAFHAVVLTGSGHWEYFFREGSTTPAHRRSGTVEINRGLNGQNRLHLRVTQWTGQISVNHQRIANLNIVRRAEPGSISVGTGFYAGHETPGYSTRFQGFQVWSLD